MGEFVQHKHIQHAVADAGAVEIGGADDHAADTAELDLFEQRLGDGGADFAFLAGGVKRRVFGHLAFDGPYM